MFFQEFDDDVEIANGGKCWSVIHSFRHWSVDGRYCPTRNVGCNNSTINNRHGVFVVACLASSCKVCIELNAISQLSQVFCTMLVYEVAIIIGGV